MDKATLITSLDIMAIFATVMFGFWGFSKGLVAEILSMAGWLGGVLLAIWIFPHLAQAFLNFTGDVLLANIATVIVLLVGTIIFLNAIRTALIVMVKSSAIGFVDRFAGLGLGLVKAALILGITFVALTATYPTREEQPDWIKRSVTMPALAFVGNAMLDYLPQVDEIRAALRKAPSAPPPRPVQKSKEKLEKTRKMLDIEHDNIKNRWEDNGMFDDTFQNDVVDPLFPEEDGGNVEVNPDVLEEYNGSGAGSEFENDFE